MSTLLENALVVEAVPGDPYHCFRLHAPTIARSIRPGQFVSADLGGLLRTPLLPAAVGEEGLDLLVPPDHPAVALLPGQEVSLLGPLGTPLPHPTPLTRLLLIADLHRFPALLPLAHRAVAAGCSAALALSTPATGALFSFLPPALEVHTLQLHDPSLLEWAGWVVAAADPALYPVLAEEMRAVRMEPATGFAHALLLPPLACGVGACRGCAVATRRGYRLACTDGPFFDLMELEVA